MKWPCPVSMALFLCLAAQVHAQQQLPEYVSAAPTPAAMPAHYEDTACDAGSAEHTKLKRLWQWLTFRYHPTPRECTKCNDQPSRRCHAELHNYMVNRYPVPAP